MAEDDEERCASADRVPGRRRTEALRRVQRVRGPAAARRRPPGHRQPTADLKRPAICHELSRTERNGTEAQRLIADRRWFTPPSTPPALGQSAVGLTSEYSTQPDPPQPTTFGSFRTHRATLSDTFRQSPRGPAGEGNRCCG